MEYISLPKNEYINLQKELTFLKNKELMQKVNELIDLMFESKYGIYLGNYTSDLTIASIDSIDEWEQTGDVWNEV